MFLSTGIPELDDLLTRKKAKAHGIAIPTHDGRASSTSVIKGEAGAGKSVLSSILAYNFHCKPVYANAKKRFILPFCVYFSFSQASESLYYYIDDILHNDKDEDAKPAKTPPYYPLIISAKGLREISESDGLATLRRCLIDNLAWLRKVSFGGSTDITDRWRGDSGVHNKLQGFASQFTSSDEWVLKRPISDIVPEEFPPCDRDEKGKSKEYKFDEDSVIQIKPVVFIDPINYFFDYRDSRAAISELFATFRINRWPLIATVEDAGEASSEAHRQLMSCVEFESDTVLNLSVKQLPYVRRTIEVKKNRNSQPRFGPQMYRIERKGHSLWNIPSPWTQKVGEHRHPGILIFPSVHLFLSHSRNRHEATEAYHSGISEFDRILKELKPRTKGNAASLPPDAYIIVRGDKGGHKLSIAFNLLVAGLWNNRQRISNKENKRIAPKSNKVLLLSLGEEIHFGVPKIALARGNPQHPKNQNNGNRIKFFASPYTSFRSPEGDEGHYKVAIHDWLWTTANDPKNNLNEAETKKAASDPDRSRLIQATFKPGHLSAEEFLWIVESLVDEYHPSRLLVENTAHLRMRFPELESQKMLFPALSNLTRSKQIMLIVTDVMGKGSNEELSYGLAAGADYVVEISILSEKHLEGGKAKDCTDKLTKVALGLDPVVDPIWAKMTVSNVRGKNYRRIHYATSVVTGSDKNSLVLVNIEDFVRPGFEP